MTRGLRSTHAPNRGSRIEAPPSEAEPWRERYPVFCLRYLKNLKKCQRDELAALPRKLYELGQFTWRELRGTQRHGAGYELIPWAKVSCCPPADVQPDTQATVFRFYGKRAMIGYTKDEVFHILLLDRDYKAYDHG